MKCDSRIGQSKNDHVTWITDPIHEKWYRMKLMISSCVCFDRVLVKEIFSSRTIYSDYTGKPN